MPLKYTVFRRLYGTVRLSVKDTIDSSGWDWRGIQVSLGPICLPKAEFYGSFFFMISYRIGRDTQDVLQSTGDGYGPVIDLARAPPFSVRS